MPDISMCNNKACPSFEKCYRAQAEPKRRRQSFASFGPNDGADKCEHFVEIQSGDVTRFRAGHALVDNEYDDEYDDRWAQTDDCASLNDDDA